MDKFEILKVASQRLKEIDYTNIYKLITQIGLSNIIGFELPKDSYIYRIRPSEKVPFNNKSEISFNPKCNNFGRANKPNNPLFYGTIAPPKMENPVYTNTKEMLHVLANGGHQISNQPINFTIGEWKNNEKIPVIPMVFHEDFLKTNGLFRPIHDNYLKANGQNKRNQEIIKFIASEFAKPNIKTPDDYKISAAFSEFVFKSYKDSREAIIYPSVRSNGNGYNIALTPNFTNKYLNLVKVGTFSYQLKNGIGHLSFEKICNEIGEDGSFELKDIVY